MLKHGRGEKVRKKIEELQKLGRLLTNCYSHDIIRYAEEIWDSEKAALFSYDDHGVKRLIYYALDKEELGKLLQQVGSGKEYVLDFLTRSPEENREVFEDVGFKILARMMRVSNPSCGSMLAELPIMAYYDDTVGYIADISETQEIKEKMWSVFDTRVSHLLYDDELAEAIKRKEICIHRNEAGEIDAFVQTPAQPKRFYFNHAYSMAGRGVVHSLILKRLYRYVCEGGEYVYAWVDEENVASLKFNGKYGMRPDGMWNVVYVKENANA